ncbi:MAG: hypothetical protein V3R17_01745 [Hyphomicrobium sp.]
MTDVMKNPQKPIDLPKMTPKRERLMLFRHGTVPWKLTPHVIYEAAKNDLHAKKVNAEIRRDRQQMPKGPMAKATLRRFAFLKAHVTEATTPVALIKKALTDREAGLARAGDEVNTLTIYSDEDSLRAALGLAKADA